MPTVKSGGHGQYIRSSCFVQMGDVTTPSKDQHQQRLEERELGKQQRGLANGRVLDAPGGQGQDQEKRGNFDAARCQVLMPGGCFRWARTTGKLRLARAKRWLKSSPDTRCVKNALASRWLMNLENLYR